MSKIVRINSILSVIHDDVKSKYDEIYDQEKLIDDFLVSLDFRNTEIVKKEMLYLINKRPGFSFQFYCDLFEYTFLIGKGQSYNSAYYQTIIDNLNDMYNNDKIEIENDLKSRLKEKREIKYEEFSLFTDLNSRISSLENKIDKIYHVLKLINVDKDVFYSRLAEILKEE